MSVFTLVLTAVSAVSGVWSPWRVGCGEWESIARLLQDGGFDTVFYNAAYGPVIDHEGLRECIEACLPLGIDVHAWVIMWRTDYLPDSVQERFMIESRLQGYSPTYMDGAVIPNWMAPADPRNVELMAKTCLEIAALHPVSGIHLDYIRYRYYLSGYSEAARERFMRETGMVRLDWPGDCLQGGRHYHSFMRWRALKMTEAVAAVRDSLDRLNRVVELSAAVLAHEREMLYFGQMWDEWLDSGLLDFAVTMNYTESDSQFLVWAGEQLPLAGDGRILCGIGFRSTLSSLSREQLLGQIGTALEEGFEGVVIFRLCRDLLDTILNGGIIPDTAGHVRNAVR